MTLLLRKHQRRPTQRTTFLDGANTPDTNGALAAHFINGVQSMQQRVDLTRMTECRLYVVRRGTAAVSGYVVDLMYSAAYESTPGNFLQIGASAVQVDANVTNTDATTAWIPLVSGARGDVNVCPIASGGDGAADPNFGIVAAEFR